MAEEIGNDYIYTRSIISSVKPNLHTWRGVGAGEQVERGVEGALQAGRQYGYHVILTSSSAAPQHLDLLAQVPQVHLFSNPPPPPPNTHTQRGLLSSTLIMHM